MVNSSDSHDNAQNLSSSDADSDINRALHVSGNPLSSKWFQLADCMCWIEQNPLLFALLLGVSWGCGQLCNYFGFIVLFGGFAWIYSQSAQSAEQGHSATTR